MQNRYVGDIGDFGKYGMLRAIVPGTGLRLGINWYLVPDESHTNDGKFVEYLNSANSNSRHLEVCDPSLYRNLKRVVATNSRNVEAIQNSLVLPPDTVFYSKPISFLPALKDEQIRNRREWFADSFPLFAGCNLLFLDPDNGLEISSEPIGSLKCAKYVLYEEVRKYYDSGFSLIIYNHRDRSAESEYQRRFLKIKECIGKDINLPVLRFSRYSVRDYAFVIQDELYQTILKRLNDFEKSLWSRHWQLRIL